MEPYDAAVPGAREKPVVIEGKRIWKNFALLFHKLMLWAHKKRVDLREIIGMISRDTKFVTVAIIPCGSGLGCPLHSLKADIGGSTHGPPQRVCNLSQPEGSGWLSSDRLAKFFANPGTKREGWR
jgi:hypothetical protein